MCVLLPSSSPAALVAVDAPPPVFAVAGSVLDFIWSGGPSANAEKTQVEEEGKGLSTSARCWDLAALAQEESRARHPDGLLIPVLELTPPTPLLGGGRLAGGRGVDEWAMHVDDEWSIEVDEHVFDVGRWLRVPGA